jgi:hypothetical protein
LDKRNGELSELVKGKTIGLGIWRDIKKRYEGDRAW